MLGCTLKIPFKEEIMFSFPSTILMIQYASLGVPDLASDCWMVSMEERVSQISRPQPDPSSLHVLLLRRSESTAFSDNVQKIAP